MVENIPADVGSGARSSKFSVHQNNYFSLRKKAQKISALQANRNNKTWWSITRIDRRPAHLSASKSDEYGLCNFDLNVSEEDMVALWVSELSLSVRFCYYSGNHFKTLHLVRKRPLDRVMVIPLIEVSTASQLPLPRTQADESNGNWYFHSFSRTQLEIGWQKTAILDVV